jgi:hypothetical protein
MGKIWGDGITPKTIWHVVKAAATRAGINNLAPHDFALQAFPYEQAREEEHQRHKESVIAPPTG